MSTCDPRLTRVKSAIGSVEDFPKPGIIFRDFFPILTSPSLTEDLIQLLYEGIQRHLRDQSQSLSSCPCSDPPIIIGLDSRGFLIGPMLAQKFKAPFYPIRKKGKLPPPTTSLEYSLEYGSDSMEISTSISASISGRDVILVDDLLATGGTMSAAEQLVEHVGGRVRLCVVVIELPEIGGRKKLKAPLQSLVQFEGD